MSIKRKELIESTANVTIARKGRCTAIGGG
jgi:hypothetical protein